MIEIGRLCVKTAGRDAAKKCIIVDILDKNFVLVDGETRRRKCNIMHLEPLETVVKIKKNAGHDEVIKEFSKIGIEIKEEKAKQKQAKTEKPSKTRKAKAKKEQIAQKKK